MKTRIFKMLFFKYLFIYVFLETQIVSALPPNLNEVWNADKVELHKFVYTV